MQKNLLKLGPAPTTTNVAKGICYGWTVRQRSDQQFALVKTGLPKRNRYAIQTAHIFRRINVNLTFQLLRPSIFKGRINDTVCSPMRDCYNASGASQLAKKRNGCIRLNWVEVCAEK